MRPDQPAMYCPWCRRTLAPGRPPCSALCEQDRRRIATAITDQICQYEMRKRPLFPRSVSALR